MTATFKLNSGIGALLCSRCNITIKLGSSFTDEEWSGARGEIKLPAQYCNHCKTKNQIDILLSNVDNKYEQGFTQKEIDSVIKHLPHFNIQKYKDSMMGNTYAIIDGVGIHYHIDVLTAISCGIDNRDETFEEWD